MKALVAYHNEIDQWCLWGMEGVWTDVVRPLSYFNLNHRGRELYPKIIEIEITRVEQGEGGEFSWTAREDLPDMPDLSQRIKKNIEFLKGWLGVRDHD